MEVRVVADENTNILFQDLGYKTVLIDDLQQGNFETDFDHILEDQDIGVIILCDKYLRGHREYFQKIKIRKLPVIVGIPDIACLQPFESLY